MFDIRRGRNNSINGLYTEYDASPGMIPSSDEIVQVLLPDVRMHCAPIVIVVRRHDVSRILRRKGAKIRNV